MRIDATAALKLWGVDVDIGGWTFRVPPLPAVDWVVAILYGGSSLAIVPGLVDGDGLDDLLMDGQVTFASCEQAAQDAIEVVSGTRWWTACRLVHAATHTDLAGELVLRGVDPGRVSLGAYLLAAHRLATRYMEDSKRFQWEFELGKPPAGVPVGEMLDEAEAASNFMALMSSGG